MKKLKLCCALVLTVSFLCPVSAHADGFDDWFKAQIQSSVEATAGKKKAVQTEAISIDHGSTNFVDQTSASDLASTTLSFLPVNGDDSAEGGSGVVTASLYSLYAMATGQDALAPSVYNRTAGLRKLFISIGREEKNKTDPVAGTPGTVYGARWLIQNQRDATSIAKDQKANLVLGQILGRLAGLAAVARTALRDVLYEAAGKPGNEGDFSATLGRMTMADLETTIGKLKKSDRARVASLVEDYVEAATAGGDDLQALVNALQRRPQFAVDFQTKQRDQTQSDDYRLQLVYDKGLSDAWSLVLNGSYDYSNTAKIGGDVRGGRGAIEFKYNITSVSGASLRTPMQIAFSGEGLSQQSQWKYRGQLRLVIPLAIGINIPLSIGYGNQSDVLANQEKNVFGKFGVTFDFAKIVDSIRSPQ